LIFNFKSILLFKYGTYPHSSRLSIFMNKQSLRIAIITSLYTPFLSGVSIAVHQRVRWLLEQGHQVFLIHPEFNDKFPQEVFARAMPSLGERKILGEL
jgi:hypothetical protein